MVHDLRTRFSGSTISRLDGRPRKLAALACLILAAISAVSGGGHATASDAPRPQPGQVAVALVLADGGAGREFLRPGEHIDLLSDTPGSALGNVTVLSVSRDAASGGLLNSGSGKADGTSLVVAADSKDVATLAALVTHRIFAAPHYQR